jgi:hypothetical protein
VGGSDPTGEDESLLRLRQLEAAITDAVDHLADLDAEDDLEAFARMLEALVSDAEALASRPGAAEARPVADDQALQAVLGHLREAHDLLDDGEPSDAVAVAVMAAGELLRRRLQG